MCFAKNVIALILLLLLTIIPNSTKAQSISTLTGTFERITDIDEIKFHLFCSPFNNF